ncbi:MAG: hypothetical protein VX498_10690 [Myxococcota bacterium]|nr:hypothetical protein [Myxococcota bacterium]
MTVGTPHSPLDLPDEEDFAQPASELEASDQVDFFGAGQLVLEDEGELRPSRGALDHPASQFLGREFMLWLWWTSERDFGTADLPTYGTVDFWIDDHIQFRTPGDDPQIADLRGGAPATTIEARTALSSGKTVESARLGLRVKEREYSFSLRAEGLELSGVKVPSEMKEGSDERIFERMFLLDEVTGIIDAFFFRFLDKRLDPAWNTEQLPAIRDWVAGEVPQPPEESEE